MSELFLAARYYWILKKKIPEQEKSAKEQQHQIDNQEKESKKQKDLYYNQIPCRLENKRHISALGQDVIRSDVDWDGWEFFIFRYYVVHQAPHLSRSAYFRRSWGWLEGRGRWVLLYFGRRRRAWRWYEKEKCTESLIKTKSMSMGMQTFQNKT